MRRERWAFTDWDLKHPEDLRSDDELVAGGAMFIHSAIIYRNGHVSNRREDGVVGLSEEEKMLAESDESPFDTKQQAYADNWRDVIVSDDGLFVRFDKSEFAR